MPAVDVLTDGQPSCHEVCLAFPVLEKAELIELADDIKANGLHHPILVDGDNKILDGRNRWIACKMVGITPELELFDGDEKDKINRVVSENIKRRSLSTQQRAAIAAELANMKPGNRSGRNRYSASSTTDQDNTNEASKTRFRVKLENNVKPSITTAQAAAMMKVGKTSVDLAKKRMRDDPKAHEAIKQGHKVKPDPKPKPPPQLKPDITDARKRAFRAYDTLQAAGAKITEKAIRRMAGVGSSVAAAVISVRAQQTGTSPPPPDPITPSIQQKLDVYKAKLDRDYEARVKQLESEFADRVREASMKWLEDVRLPMYEREMRSLEALLNSPRFSVMTQVEYKKILMCLHPDGLAARTAEQLREAFLVFTKYKHKMVSDRETKDEALKGLPPLPTLQELLRRRQARA